MWRLCDINLRPVAVVAQLTTPIPFASLPPSNGLLQRMSPREAHQRKEWGMARVAKTNKARLGTLLLALVGCVVVAVPMVYSLAEPVPMTLIGCGVSTIALALFLFFSL